LQYKPDGEHARAVLIPYLLIQSRGRTSSVPSCNNQVESKPSTINANLGEYDVNSIARLFSPYREAQVIEM
jgi:hypothetical protein